MKKFKYYLLANKFIFFVDHQALLYLVNKLCATRWFVILLEFDFEVAIKKGTMHQRANHLLRITSREATMSINDNLSDAILFNIEWVLRWSEELVSFLNTAVIPNDKLKETVDFVKATSNFVLIAGHLYYKDMHTVLKQVACPEDYFSILKDVHLLSCGQHLAQDHIV